MVSILPKISMSQAFFFGSDEVHQMQFQLCKFRYHRIINEDLNPVSKVLPSVILQFRLRRIAFYNHQWRLLTVRSLQLSINWNSITAFFLFVLKIIRLPFLKAHL